MQGYPNYFKSPRGEEKKPWKTQDKKNLRSLVNTDTKAYTNICA